MQILATILILLISNGIAKANTIDSLKTKQEVKNFLKSHFSHTDITFMYRYADLTVNAKHRAHLLEPRSVVPDTIQVQDPITNEWFLKTLSHEFDSIYYQCEEPNNYDVTYSFDSVAARMDDKGYKFFKADIDGNGYTDLVIEAGPMIAVMDMVGKLEGHILSMQTDTSAYGLSPIISLPEGSVGLVIRNGTCGPGMSGVKENKNIDTVVYEFRSFLKDNRDYKPSDISKINYQFIDNDGMPCDGFTTMEIDVAGDCFLKYSQYSTAFSGRVEREQLDDLWNFVSYVNLKAKEDVYINWATHTTGCALSVYFNDGTIKRIYAWDCSPSRSVNYLTKRIADICDSVDWQPEATPPEFEDVRISPSNNSVGDVTAKDCDCHW